MKNLVFLAVAVAIGAFLSTATLASEEGQRAFKILHVMSYHTPWRWTEDQFQGFRDALKGVEAEYRVFEMDTKQRSSDAWRFEAGEKARRLIDSWKPDLVYTNDDNAQEFVARHYLGADVPFVFSGVNAAPEEYGFRGVSNVTGVLEQEHFVQTVRLLRRIVPTVKRVAMVIDEGATWPGVVSRIKDRLADLPEIEIVAWDTIGTFAEYKRKVKEYQGTVDAIGLLGIFTFRDEDGNNVPYHKVLRWTAENSAIPDFSFWQDRVDFGTLCVVSVSGYQQGLAAGRKARAILVDGISPGDIPMEPTLRGEPFISLARANRLGIAVRSSDLLSSHVLKDFIWER